MNRFVTFLITLFLSLCFFANGSVSQPARGWGQETHKWVRNIQGNSGTISLKSIWAGDQYVKEMYRDGDRALFQYALPCVGNQLSAALCPLIYDVGTSVAQNLGVTPLATYSESLGITGNLTGYLDTGATLTSIGSTSNWHLACYASALQVAHASLQKGILSTAVDATGTPRLQINVNTGTNGIVSMQGAATISANSSGDLTVGHYLFSRISSTNLSYYKNGTYVTKNVTSDTSTITSSSTLKLFAYDAGGAISRYNDNSYNFFTFGYALNDAAAAREGARQANFKARMGR